MMTKMIKNKKYLLLLFVVFSFFLLNKQVFAINVYQSDYYYINDYVVSYKNINSSKVEINGKSILEFTDYIEEYINSNKIVDINYSIFINSYSSDNFEVIFSLSRNYNCSTSFRIYSDTFGSNTYSYKVNVFSTGEYEECIVGGSGSDSKVFVFSSSMTSSEYNNVFNYLSNFILDKSSSSSNNNSYSYIGTKSLDFDYNQDIYLSIENSTSFLPYKTTNTIYYKQPVSESTTSYTRYERDLEIEYLSFNEKYTYNSSIPTFLELYDLVPEKPDISFIDKSFILSYYGLFISQIPVLNVYDYKLDFTISQSEIYDDVTYKYNLFGRVNNGNYYTYEPISCVIGTSNDEPYEGVGTIKYTKHLGISECSSDLSKYDYVYINVFSDKIHPIGMFKYTSNYGYVTVNDFIASTTSVVDYFNFDSDTNLLVSSKNNSQSLYYGSDEFNKFLVTSYDLTNFNSKKYFIATRYDKHYRFYERFDYIGTSTNNAVGVNLFSNYSSGKFYILVDEDISVSINLSSDNKTFYYYNSSGDIISNDFNIYHSYSPNPIGTTSVDNFFDIVVDYIDSFSSDINQFSVVLQNCYDLAPEFIRNLIFVVFILSMSVILYKLIGK